MFLPRSKRQLHYQEQRGNGEATQAAIATFFFIALLWFCTSAGRAQEIRCASQGAAGQEQVFRVVFWNVENLFDTQHDTLKNDHEFLPDGARRWHYGRYRRKLINIARALTAIGEWEAPALIGMCEVENDTVLRDLTLRSPFRAERYRYVMTDSPDTRGIDVALLYRRDLFKLLSYRSIGIPPLERQRPTRDLLHVCGLAPTGDTLDVFVCHLPSRSGGAKASAPFRMHAARILRTEVDSLLQVRSHPQVIIMGDFNDTPTDASIRQVLEAVEPSPSPSPFRLYHLMARRAKSSTFGSYRYRGRWMLLDHIIVSGTLLNPSNPLHTDEEKASVCRLPSLRSAKDEEEEAGTPYRTYRGTFYQGGFSDHLPVRADFYFKWK